MIRDGVQVGYFHGESNVSMTANDEAVVRRLQLEGGKAAFGSLFGERGFSRIADEIGFGFAFAPMNEWDS